MAFSRLAGTVFLSGCLLLGEALADSPPPGAAADFPPLKLRGYGTLGGAFTPSRVDGQAASVLKLACESVEKAKLVHAKYLSDLQAFGAVQAITVTGGAATIPAWEVEGRGAVLAARDGATVYALAAASARALGKLAGATFAGRQPVFAPEMAVPMFLDRWDKYGFRFYDSYPFQTPKGEPGYDLPSLYDFAAQHDHAGLQFWAGTDHVDTAEGLSEDQWWGWAAMAGTARKLPLGLNINAGFEAPVWLMNRYRDQAAQRIPGFVGAFYDPGFYNLGGPGWLSWASTTGNDQLFGTLQQTVRRWVGNPAVTSYMEPHAETEHGTPDLFLEYGPVADASYRGFLQKLYPSLGALNAAWGTDLENWTAVRVPELCSFAGFGPGALDLDGDWRIGFEPRADGTSPARAEMAVFPKPEETKMPEAWFDPAFDDRSWPVLATGDDTQTLLPRWPAVWRRPFDVPADWKGTGSVWLYVWDLSRGGDELRVALNGKPAGTSKIGPSSRPHWAAFEVGGLLQPGANQISLRIPQGHLNYKVYLSHTEPRQYPELGEHLNAQWANFIDWDRSIRADGVRRGMEMIRQVDPDRGILLASPDSYAEGIKDDAKRYGGDFHNTGYMAGNWVDRLPAWMRGAGLPMSVEPGNPAHNVPELQTMFGLWLTEGVNAIDYFMNVGDIMWSPDVRAKFDENLKLYQSIGKYHAPFAEVAALYSTRMDKLMGYPWSFGFQNGNPDDTKRGFPWHRAPAPYLGSGAISLYDTRGPIRNAYDTDALTETSFQGGDAARYKVILDTDTAIMDEATVADIERYVRAGGTFITYGQTGRHTSTRLDAWPMERLTGYHVADPAFKSRKLRPADGQQVFSADGLPPAAYGMELKKVADDATALAVYDDGATAIGMRPLGKGWIIQVGCAMAHEPLTKMLKQLIASRGVAAIPGQWAPENPKTYFRHSITNNGLYDVWTVWNSDKGGAIDGTLSFDAGLHPAWALSVKDGSRVALNGAGLPLRIEADDTVAYLTPRPDITQSAREWITLQRGWWQGTTPPPATPLPPPEHLRSLDLREGWAFQPLGEKDDAAPLAAPGYDDSKWEKRRFEIWNFPDHPDVRRALLRRSFTVPAAWKDGEIGLWMISWQGAFRDTAQVYLDGKPIDLSRSGLTGVNPGNVLQAGTMHTVAADISGKTTVDGPLCNAWLWYRPHAPAALDLSGAWDVSPDGLSYSGTAAIPGQFTATLLRWKGMVPADQKARRAVVDIETVGPLHMLIVNGRAVARHHHNVGPRWELDVTPFIRFGEVNEIKAVSNPGAKNAEITRIALKFFDPGI